MDNPMFAKAAIDSPFFISSKLCKLNVENVVKPPSMPIMIKDLRLLFKIWRLSKNAMAIPITRHPRIFTVTVPEGKD